MSNWKRRQTTSQLNRLFEDGQQPLFPQQMEDLGGPKPVNVSSVPQRSPFRYPGGKTWFVPTFRYWMSRLSLKSTVLIEPFAGGGIISLTALFESFVEKAVMAELDDEVAAVWQCIAQGQSEELARQILAFDVTKDTVTNEILRTPCTQSEKAFQTILKNRTFHGGILAHGSGLLKYGENGKGVRSRWYPKTLARRLLDLQRIADKIDFRHIDGLQVIQEFAARSDAAYFIDPPYTAGGKRAGRRLYKHYDLDHESLFSLCSSVAGNFLMTYDNAEEVRLLARRHGFQMRLIPMTNTHHATMEELVIGRDLSCLDRLPAVHEPREQYGDGPEAAL